MTYLFKQAGCMEVTSSEIEQLIHLITGCAVIDNESYRPSPGKL